MSYIAIRTRTKKFEIEISSLFSFIQQLIQQAKMLSLCCLKLVQILYIWPKSELNHNDNSVSYTIPIHQKYLSCRVSYKLYNTQIDV